LSPNPGRTASPICPDLIYDRHSQYMARMIPRATLVIVPRSGHYPNIDEPAIFDDVLSKFLAQLLPE
jgi:pimeloyl-ACP methyl ester carboxylesterase